MKEIWELISKDELGSLRLYEQRMQEIPLEIETIREQLTSIKSATSNAIPVKGGGNRREEWLVNSLDRIEKLEAEKKYAEGQAKFTYAALDVLTHEERRILEVLYVDKQKKGADRLCDELGFLDVSTVWKHRKTALERYSLARHGAY